MVVTDEDVDISDPDEVTWAIATRVRFDRDAVIKSDLPGSIIDPSTTGGERTPDVSLLATRASKMGLDATKPLSEAEKFQKIDVPAAVKEKIRRVIEG